MPDSSPSPSTEPAPLQDPLLPPELLIKIAQLAVEPSLYDDSAGREEAAAISLTCRTLRDVGQARLFRRVETTEQLEVMERSKRLAGMVKESEWSFPEEGKKAVAEEVGRIATLVKTCQNLCSVAILQIPLFFLPTVLLHLSSASSSSRLTSLHLSCTYDTFTNWNGTDFPLFLHALTSFRSLETLVLDLDVDRVFPDELEIWCAARNSLPPPITTASASDVDTPSSPVYFPFLTSLTVTLHRWANPVTCGLLFFLLPTVSILHLDDRGVDDAAFLRLVSGLFIALNTRGLSSLEDVQLSYNMADCRDETSEAAVALYGMLARLPSSVKALRLFGIKISEEAAEEGGRFMEMLKGMKGRLEVMTCYVEYRIGTWTRSRNGQWEEVDFSAFDLFSVRLEL